MPPDQAGPQAARMCALFAERYDWKPQETTAVIVDAIERHYLAGTPPVPPSPWAVLARATAPPRQRPPADSTANDPPARLRLAGPRAWGSGRS
jgi:hypothetical protein